jgi:lipopolysaccharide biosynthesis glycosyltransferase
MLTDDLYDKYHKLLEVVYDEVFKINYLDFNGGKLCSKKQEELYKDWKNISFTKWQCLNLSQYSKICFLDADLVITQNIDHLFKLKAPAAAFVNYWAEFSHLKTKSYYDGIKFGKQIPSTAIKKGLKDWFVLIGHCLVLEPSKSIYDGYIKFMKTKYKPHAGSISMVDEKAITDYMLSINKKWTQLDHMHNTIPWHIKKTNIVNIKGADVFKPPYIIHFFNKEKPWIMKRSKWADTEIWWQFYDSLKESKSLEKFKELFINLEKFNIPAKKYCAYCKLISETVGDSQHQIKKTKNYNAVKPTVKVYYKPNTHCMIKSGKKICKMLV